MRYIVLACITICAMLTTTCNAQDLQQKKSTANAATSTGEAEPGLKHIDTTVSSDEELAPGYDDERTGVMPAGESYDENTGLPDVVPSDEQGNLE